MMRTDVGRLPVKRIAGALCAGGIVLLIGLAALRNEARFATMQLREETRVGLDAVAAEIGAGLRRRHDILAEAARGYTEETFPPQQIPAQLQQETNVWMAGDFGLEVPGDSSANLYLQQNIGRIVASGKPLAGVVTATNGGRGLVLQEPVGRGGTSKLGIVVPLDELWHEAGVLNLVAAGTTVHIVSDNGEPLYWSSPMSAGTPVSSRITFADTTWRLEALPGAARAVVNKSLSVAILVCIVSLGYALWYLWQTSRPDELRGRIAAFEERLANKNNEISRLLQSHSRLEAQLASSLTMDTGTGLPNHAGFLTHLQSMLSRCRRESGDGVLVAVVRFAKLEELAHSIGASAAQDVIGAAADRLRVCLHADEFLGRSGEKDLAVCASFDPALNVDEFCDRLRTSIGDRFAVGNKEVYAPGVIGIAVSPNGYDHGPDIVGQASLAAATAIHEGSSWSLFRQSAKDEKISLLQLEADLHETIRNNELKLFFQPIVAVADQSVVGFEALLRWRHPTESWIAPDRFIPLAESMEQMPRISDWVIRQAVAHASQWTHLRDIPIYLTVNLTPHDLNSDTCQLLLELIRQSGIPASCIRVEVTEFAVVNDFRVAARLINDLHRRGIHVLLDDFGTGYSSLSYLRDLPFQTVKIDKSFTQRMTTEAQDFGLFKSIVGLVQYLGMDCIAEGVETQEQLDLVALANCSHAQGYLFSRPVPAAEVEGLILGAAAHQVRAREAV